MYYFIIHLSIADLLTALLTLLPEIIWTATIDFYGGNVVCKLTKFAQMIGPYLRYINILTYFEHLKIKTFLIKETNYNYLFFISNFSSYVLVMTAIDRYQAICNPLSNFEWTPKRSNIMISVAWTISLLLCIPQMIIFSINEDNTNCVTVGGYFLDLYCKKNILKRKLKYLDNIFFNFIQTFIGGPKGWGVKAYIVWYGISNFFVPLVILAFCYLRISYVIWENFNSKTINLEETEKNGGWREKIRQTFKNSNTSSKMTWLSSMRTLKRNKKYLEDEDDSNPKNQSNPADTFRVHNEESLEKIQWQKQSDYCEGKFPKKDNKYSSDFGV